MVGLPFFVGRRPSHQGGHWEVGGVLVGGGGKVPGSLLLEPRGSPPSWLVCRREAREVGGDANGGLRLSYRRGPVVLE